MPTEDNNENKKPSLVKAKIAALNARKPETPNPVLEKQGKITPSAKIKSLAATGDKLNKASNSNSTSSNSTKSTNTPPPTRPQQATRTQRVPISGKIAELQQIIKQPVQPMPMKPEEVKRVIPEPKESNVPEKTIIKTKQEIKEEIVKGITASGRAMPPDRIIQSMVDREYARLTEEVQKQAASEESETPTPKKTANSNQNNPSTPGVTIDPQRLATLRAGLKQIKEQPKAAPKEVENKQPSWVKPGR